MSARFRERIRSELDFMRAEGTHKTERVIRSQQGTNIRVDSAAGPLQVLNFCANNYLGLAADERVVRASVEATTQWGAGTSSVRFICGTLGIHKELEIAIAEYLGFEEAVLFAAAFDANGGIFDALLGEEDVIVSDKLNHASLIDGIRLAKARCFHYPTGDMEALEKQLRAARGESARDILIATDGVFSMDGHIARLPEIAELARRYDALVMVDDCHATGCLGNGGRGSFDHCGVGVDIVTGTFGKALGGSMGGFICADKEVIELLRQRARPYLFSNALAPSICGASLEAIRISRSDEGDRLRERLFRNAQQFRHLMSAAGFTLAPGEHPIIPVMLGDAKVAQAMAAALLHQGVFVTGFSYPVVPRGKARIRTQISAAHTSSQIEAAVEAFARVGRRLGVAS